METVLALVAAGLNDCEISRRTRIPRCTVRDWRHGRTPDWDLHDAVEGPCAVDHAACLPGPEYAYLLGIYLGDGCISRDRRGVWRLRIVADARYPCILEEIARAMEAMFPTKRAYRLDRRGCVEISMYSKHWTCLFPQHGPGRKHLRPIELADWQRMVVETCPGSLLRGLIHSDGCRILARERKGRYVRHAPRYHFSNRSEDIKRIFCDTCDLLGIHWTRPNTRGIAIYRLASVARLDEFVGPKQ